MSGKDGLTGNAAESRRSDDTTSIAPLTENLTADEIARRRRALEPQLYRKHGVIILKRDDADLIGFDRILFDRIALERFGKPSQP